MLARIAETGKPVMELQGRTVPIPGDNKATQWSAFAIGYFGGTTVEVWGKGGTTVEVWGKGGTTVEVWGKGGTTVEVWGKGGNE